jgi:hypothetical protein
MKGRHGLLVRSLLVIGLTIAVASPAFAGTDPDQATLILNPLGEGETWSSWSARNP